MNPLPRERYDEGSPLWRPFVLFVYSDYYFLPGSYLAKAACYAIMQEWEIAPGYAKGHRLVMSHYPMLSWNGKARGAIMLHGHIHSRGDRTNARNRDRERPIYRYDVGVDANNYKPVSRDQILNFFGL